MTDLLSIVTYERAHPVALVHPKTKKPIGVTFKVTHIDSAAPSRVAADAEATEAITGKRSGKTQLRMIAACIQSWEWGDYTFGDDKKAPELTLDKAVEVLDKAPWIINQISAEVYNLSNFTDS